MCIYQSVYKDQLISSCTRSVYIIYFELCSKTSMTSVLYRIEYSYTQHQAEKKGINLSRKHCCNEVSQKLHLRVLRCRERFSLRLKLLWHWGQANEAVDAVEVPNSSATGGIVGRFCDNVTIFVHLCGGLADWRKWE